MTVALRDVEAFAAALRGSGRRTIADMDDADIMRCVAAFRQRRLALAGTVNTLANALHRVFSIPAGGRAEDVAVRAVLRAACLE